MAAAPTVPMFIAVCEPCEEGDGAAPTEIQIFLVVWESDFDMQDPTNDKASGGSESREVGELLHLHIHLSVRYHLPECLGQFGVNGFRPSKEPSRGEYLHGRTGGRL